MKSIITKSLRPTNAHGARIKVTCWAGSMILPYPGSPGIDSHKFVVDRLVSKLNVEREAQGFKTIWRVVSWGTTPSEDGYAFIIEQEWVE